MLTKKGQDAKFSVINYAHRLKAKESKGSVHRLDKASLNQFRKLAEDMRAYLITQTGKTEAQQQRKMELLNRAVLGFAEERKYVLTMIQDELLKRRIQHAPPPGTLFQSLAEAVFAEIVGLNVLELVLKNRDELEEIQVVGRNIYEVRGGVPSLSPHRFESIRDVERIQQNLVLFNNDTLNYRKRWAETILSDGARVTMTGFGFTSEPTITLRFYTVKRFNLKQLCDPKYETMNDKVRQLILCILRSYFNIVVIGATNTGKTHLIKAFIGELPDHERIVTIESRFELMLKRDFPNKNIIEYETVEDDSKHDSSQAFKLALRQSPQRICHTEIRDEDANIYVRACTRGHEGSMTTVHVNALEDVPDAITDMCMLDRRGMDPARLVQRITNYVTQIGIEMGLAAGKRKILRVVEYEYRDDKVNVNDLISYCHTTNEWKFPEQLSPAAIQRISRNDPAGLEVLRRLGLVQS